MIYAHGDHGPETLCFADFIPEVLSILPYSWVTSAQNTAAQAMATWRALSGLLLIEYNNPIKVNKTKSQTTMDTLYMY